MPRVNGVRRSTAGVRRVVTPTAQELKREIDAGIERWNRSHGREPETREQVRARFMGRVIA